MTVGMIPTLLLDLDGTLVDSVPDLRSALNRLLAARQLALFTVPDVAAMVGDGVAALVTRALTARGAPTTPADIAAFSTDYTAHAAVETRPYPGIEPALQAFATAGWRLAVCTNKPEAAARAVLAALGLLDRFAAIGGGDSFPVRKPDPAHLLATLAAGGGDPAACVMVGDHRNDVEAAAAARLPCIFAAWGYGPRTMADGADAVAERPADLPRLAAQLLTRAPP